MTEYIKVGSDRPNFRIALTDRKGRRVNLSKASNVSLLMWDPDANLLINDTAEVDVASEGIVEYDFDRDQTVAVGTNEAEIRVDWSDGDKQWFPIETRAFEVEITRAPGDRDATLDNPGAVEDAEVNRLTIHDAIETNDASDLSVVNGLTVGGDLTVGGAISISAQQLGDGEAISYGTDGDFETVYDATADRWKLVDLTNSHDAIRVDRQGALIVPNGNIQTDTAVVYDSVDQRIGDGLVDSTSLDLGINPTWTAQHTFAAGLETDGDIVHGTNTIYDASRQLIPADIVETGDTGAVTINSGKGIKGGASLQPGESLTLNIEPGDFAGTALQDDGSDTLEIADNAVTSTQLGVGAVGQNNIADGAVGAAAVEDSMSPTWTGDHNFTGQLERDGVPVANVHQQPNAHIPLTDIPDGERAYQCAIVPDGATFELAAWGVTDETGSVPDVGLEITDGSGTLLHGGGVQADKYESGNPLYETTNSSGSTEVFNMAILNTSGSVQTASAFFSYAVSL